MRFGVGLHNRLKSSSFEGSRPGKETPLKKETTPKKLRLSRETLRELADKQVEAVQGGVQVFQDYPITSDSVNACCC